MGVGNSCYNMGCLNQPPCMINQLFPKFFHLALGVLSVTDSVPVYLEDLDARAGWILKSRVD